jgi:hypothetical protein
MWIIPWSRAIDRGRSHSNVRGLVFHICLVATVTEIVLYDLRSSDAQDGFIQSCNQSLASDTDNQYLKDHGAIGSREWWEHFDAGRIRLKSIAGLVTHIGPRIDYVGETEDVVCFESNGREQCYDRDGIWNDNRIQLGDRICVLRTKATVPHKYGDCIWHIDVRITLMKDANNAASPSSESEKVTNYTSH